MRRYTSNLCIKCKAVLAVGININKNYMNKSDYNCHTCRSVGRKASLDRLNNDKRRRDIERARQQKWREDHKGLMAHYCRVRELKKKQRMPAWANLEDIRKIYEECAALNKEHGPNSYHVDHIIPLQGKTVSGLPVENNLQILKASDNLAKSNKYVQQ